MAAGAAAQEPVRAHLPTTTQLTVASGGEGASATFTIQVLGGDRGIPTGAVTLNAGRSSLGSVLLDGNGAATFHARTAEGLDQITAIYEGDDSFDPSASLTLAAPAASTVPTFTLSAAPTTLTVKVGAFVTSTVTVTPSNGFADPVLLSCSGLPANSTCAFNPVYVTPGGTAPATTAATATLTIQTVAPTSSRLNSLPGEAGRRGPLYAVLVPGFAALAGLGLLRRRAFGAMRLLGVGFLLIASAVGLGACSPRYSYFAHPPLKNPGTTVGTFTVLVNGSSASAGAVIIPPAVPVVLTVTK